ncbi:MULTISPECIES: TadE/TadG family type IV pilus assembly protein [unclassified Ruegeria]|uniref:TadE/TadG family type IV pilus assembly protein n=1 Tax=unclassified Ruegeria TaxID=2625375 RepID=UPI001487ECDE|nr:MULTISPECIES: TadE/TadG family type IV pilus assembly protein [unclassified Ruegeria]
MTRYRTKADATKTPDGTSAQRDGAFSGIARRTRRWWRDEDGTTLVEFSVCLPLLLLFLFITLEFSYLIVRQVALDRSTDETFRELRLGLISDPTHEKVKTAICAKSLAQVSLWDCDENLLLEVRQVEKSDWEFNLNGRANCLNTSPPDGYEPPIDFTEGTENQLMIARACLVQRSLFPPMPMLASLRRYDDLGNFALISRSAFVNEPF